MAKKQAPIVIDKDSSFETLTVEDIDKILPEARELERIDKEQNSPVKVKLAQFHVGVDMIGTKQSCAAGKFYDLTEHPNGIKIHSKKTGEKVVIPYSNVRGYKLL